jgi:hypothetical protein
MNKEELTPVNLLRLRFLNDASMLCGKEYGEGYLEALAHVEKMIGEAEAEPEPSLLEQTWYSYLGIASLIRDDPKKRLVFMRELHTAYFEAMQAENAAQKSLESAKRQSALIHGAYHYTHRVLNTGGDGFCYALDGVTHVVTLRTTIPVIESWKPDIE